MNVPVESIPLLLEAMTSGIHSVSVVLKDGSHWPLPISEDLPPVLRSYLRKFYNDSVNSVKK